MTKELFGKSPTFDGVRATTPGASDTGPSDVAESGDDTTNMYHA